MCIRDRFKLQKKELKRNRDHSTSTATPVQQRHLQAIIDTSMQSLTQTPDIGLCEGVDAFAKFCQVFKFNLMSYLFEKKFYTSNDRV